MNYNPYDLVNLRIGGQEIQGRPYEFDSQPSNQQTMQNAFGGFVKPTHISTVCPECGQGILIENIVLPDPPFPVVEWVCPHCNPDVPPPLNAFANPLETGRIMEHELDPLLHNPDEQVVADDTTVADRIEEVEKKTTKKSAKKKSAKKKTAKKKSTKKKSAKKKPTKDKEDTGKSASSKETKASDKDKEAPPDVQEVDPLTTKAPSRNLEPAEGLKEEFDDDDLVEE